MDNKTPDDNVQTSEKADTPVDDAQTHGTTLKGRRQTQPIGKGDNGMNKNTQRKPIPNRPMTRRVEGRPFRVYRWALANSKGGKLDKILANITQNAKKATNSERTPYAKKLRKRASPVRRITQKVWYIYFRYFPPFLLARWMLDGMLMGNKATLAFLKDIHVTFGPTKPNVSRGIREVKFELEAKSLRSKHAEHPIETADKEPNTETGEEPLRPVVKTQGEQTPTKVGLATKRKDKNKQLEAAAAAAVAVADRSDCWESAMSSPEKSPPVPMSRKAIKSHVEVNYSDMVDSELRKMTSSSMWLLLGYAINVFTFVVVSLSSICSTMHRWAGVPEFTTSQDCVDKTDLLVKLVGSLETGDTMNERETNKEHVWLLDRVLEQGVKDMSHIPGMHWVFRLLGARQRIRITGKLLDILKGVASITSKKENRKPSLVEYLADDPLYVEEQDPDYTPSAGSSSEESLEYVDDSEMTLTEEEDREDKEDDTVKEVTTEEDEEEENPPVRDSIEAAETNGEGTCGGSHVMIKSEKNTVPVVSKTSEANTGNDVSEKNNVLSGESVESTAEENVSKDHDIIDSDQSISRTHDKAITNGRQGGEKFPGVVTNSKNETEIGKDFLYLPVLSYVTITSCSSYGTTSSPTLAGRSKLSGEQQPTNSSATDVRPSHSPNYDQQAVPLPPIATIFNSVQSALQSAEKEIPQPTSKSPNHDDDDDDDDDADDPERLNGDQKHTLMEGKGNAANSKNCIPHETDIANGFSAAERNGSASIGNGRPAAVKSVKDDVKLGTESHQGNTGDRTVEHTINSTDSKADEVPPPTAGDNTGIDAKK